MGDVSAERSFAWGSGEVCSVREEGEEGEEDGEIGG